MGWLIAEVIAFVTPQNTNQTRFGCQLTALSVFKAYYSPMMPGTFWS